MDTSKYLLTVGLISGLIADKLHPVLGMSIFFIAIIAAVLGFYVIPEVKED